MTRLFLGPCPVCGITIWKYEDRIVDGKEVKTAVQNELGAHFWIKSNYNSIAKFAICKTCLNKLNDDTVDKIVDMQVFTWLWDAHMLKRELFNKYRFYYAVDWAKSEAEVIQKCKPV